MGAGFKQLLVASIFIDDLKLTVEKQQLQTSNVMDLVTKLRKQDALEDEVEPPPEALTTEQRSLQGLLSDAMDTTSNVARGTVNLGSGAINSVHEHITSIGKAEAQKPPKRVEVVIAKLRIRGIDLDTVSSILTDNQAPSVTLHAPDVEFEEFTKSIGESRPSRVIQLILMQIILSASNAAASEIHFQRLTSQHLHRSVYQLACQVLTAFGGRLAETGDPGSWARQMGDSVYWAGSATANAISASGYWAYDSMASLFAPGEETATKS